MEEALREEALREEALMEEALREEALREEALREEALREEALREEALMESSKHIFDPNHLLIVGSVCLNVLFPHFLPVLIGWSLLFF